LSCSASGETLMVKCRCLADRILASPTRASPPLSPSLVVTITQVRWKDKIYGSSNSLSMRAEIHH
jgi:hypothetical protein